MGSGAATQRILGPMAARLILLNGPPAAGKSTLARRFVAAHPPALDLDVDRVRDLIGGWREKGSPAGRLARRIALAAAGAHLAGGYDVIVPQFVGRLAFVEELAALASEAGAAFHEVVLLQPKATTLSRFADRSATSGAPEHLDADRMLQHAGGAAALAVMYDELLDVIAARPATKVVQVLTERIEDTYQALLDALR